MTNVAWCTDVHLDFLDNRTNEIVAFGESLIKDNPDVVLITGDISIANSLVYHLSALERVVQRPVYFVLGNHDFYGGGIEHVRKEMKELGNSSQYLKYLPTTPYVALSSTTGLVGHDGWYDTGYGNVKASNFIMNDWIRISDYVNEGAMGGVSMYGGHAPNYAKIVTISKKLAHEATVHVMNGIKAAVRYHKVILIATHFPPFEEAHVYNGQKGDAAHQPWYTNKMMGDMIKQAAAAYPKVRFEVFAGHTHGKFDGQIANNLYCHVGGAEYNDPKLQNVIKVP